MVQILSKHGSSPLCDLLYPLALKSILVLYQRIESVSGQGWLELTEIFPSGNQIVKNPLDFFFYIDLEWLPT